VRLRHERIDEDGEEDRARMRFRSQFGLSAKVSDEVKFVFPLATGGDNPVSTNQSFDDGFSTKDIGVDLAYIDWKVNDDLNFYGGKMKNPLYKAGGVPLIWDGDLNPEGFAVKYTSGNFFGTVGGFSVEERSSDDSLLYVVQAGMKFPVGDTANLTAGIGYFAELSTEVGDWPLKVYAHATRNSDAPTEDTGFTVGAKVGSAKKDGEMEFSWTYMDLETDAVIGTYSDSDFGGGGTDSDGHMLKAKYAVSRKIFLGGTLFLNNVDRFQGTKHDYNRLQLDVEFKFD